MKEIHLMTKTNPAPFWKRVVAYIIDLFIIDLVIVYPFKEFFAKDTLTYASLFMSETSGKLFWVSTAILLLSLLYWVLFEWKINQSIGKLIMNLSVVPVYATNKVANPKTEINFSQSVIRNITKPFPVALLIDTAYMFFKKQNQRLFEVFSHTAVLETKIMFKPIAKGDEK